TTEEWVRDRLGGYVRLSIEERREAVAELTEGDEGLSNREAATILGVDEGTVRGDKASAEDSAPKDGEQIGLEGDGAESSAPKSTRELLAQSDQNDWRTPRQYLDAARTVLGEIDLDPCADAEHRVPAKAHYTQKQNGLSRGWAGKVYMNPPYGRELPDWVVKLCLEYTASSVTDAIALVPARTDTEWFRALRDYPRCFIFGRLKFSGHENSAPFPSMVVYLGKDEHGFINTFRDTGDMYARIDGDT
ncbi:hypothetical protein LCGC14_2139190, partial [marine sediment metagenome]